MVFPRESFGRSDQRTTDLREVAARTGKEESYEDQDRAIGAFRWRTVIF